MAAAPSGQEFTFPADTTICSQIHARVMDFILASGVSPDVQMELDLAVQESLVNAVVHGCKRDASKTVFCAVSLEGDAIVFVVRDPGPGFDPAEVPDPLTEKGRGGFSGRGVHLIKALMDEVTFAHGGAEIRMRKQRT